MNEWTRPVPAQSIFNPCINPGAALRTKPAQVGTMAQKDMHLSGTAKKPVNIFYEYSDKVTRNHVLCLFISMGIQSMEYVIIDEMKGVRIIPYIANMYQENPEASTRVGAYEEAL